LFTNGSAAWVNRTNNCLIEFGYQVGPAPNEDKFYLRYEYDAAGTDYKVYTDDTVSTLLPKQSNEYLQFYHFALTKEYVTLSTTYTYKLYINGELVQTWDNCPVQDNATNGSAGTWKFASSVDLPLCYLDHFSITESALTQTQIQKAYAYEGGTLYPVPGDVDLANYRIGIVLNSCELVTDAATTHAAPMAYCRYAFGMTQLPDGRVIVAGGLGYNNNSDYTEYSKAPLDAELKSVEIFDPATMLWSSLPDMHESRSYPTMGYDADTNRVYVAGGLTSLTAEYLDLETMTWHLCIDKLASTRLAVLGQGGVTNGTLIQLGAQYWSGMAPLGVTSRHNLLVFGQETVRGGGINDLHKVTAVNGTSFTINTPEHTSWTSATTGEVLAVHAPTSSIDSCYIFSPKEGVGITGTKSTTSVQLDKGRSYQLVTLASTTAFPDEQGYLVFNWGYEDQVGPVKYLRNTSSTQLQLDPSYKFTKAVPVGSVVNLLETAGPYVPSPAGPVGGFFLTASPSGRVFAEQTLEDISAAGIDLEVTVRYPGDRGLGGEGLPARSNYRLTDAVSVWGGDDLDGELTKAKE
jgi:hypothetical protein